MVEIECAGGCGKKGHASGGAVMCPKGWTLVYGAVMNSRGRAVCSDLCRDAAHRENWLRRAVERAESEAPTPYAGTPLPIATAVQTIPATVLFHKLVGNDPCACERCEAWREENPVEWTPKPGDRVWHKAGAGPWTLVQRSEVAVQQVVPRGDGQRQLATVLLDTAWTVEVAPGKFEAMAQASLSPYPTVRRLSWVQCVCIALVSAFVGTMLAVFFLAIRH